MSLVDLRSDTVTRPTKEMFDAITNSKLGDDVYQDDSTANELQEKAADLLGKEDALIVTSGTQGNLISILAQTNRGDEVIVGNKSHIYNYEAGSTMIIGGTSLFPIPNNIHGSVDTYDLQNAKKTEDFHKPITKMLALENTHNMAGGKVLNLAELELITSKAKELSLSLHLDGARLFNASIYLGVEAKKITNYFDSVTFCLSKGLCCPIGSVIAGNREFINECRRWRKILGSGMRQVGVIAAPGILALDTMIERLAEDHQNATFLAEGLANIKGIIIDPESIQTNIIRFNLSEKFSNKSTLLVSELMKKNIIINPSKNDYRIVTHHDISRENCEYFLLCIAEILDNNN